MIQNVQISWTNDWPEICDVISARDTDDLLKGSYPIRL